MAVSIANKTKGSSSTDATSYNTASHTPAANKLQLLRVVSRTGTGVNPVQPTASGNGLTWVAINTTVYDNSSSSRRRVTLFRALGASPTTGATTIDFGGTTQTACEWSIDEATGMDISGTNGSGAIVQSAVNQDTGGSATSLTVTLSSFSSTNNATFGAFGFGDAGQTQSVGSGFTELSNQYTGTIEIGGISEWKATNDTGVDVGSTSGTEIGGIAIEIKAASETKMQLNIGDTWKTVSGLQVNIGDTWRTVTHVWINISDSWKQIF